MPFAESGKAQDSSVRLWLLLTSERFCGLRLFRVLRIEFTVRLCTHVVLIDFFASVLRTVLSDGHVVVPAAEAKEK